MEHAREHWGSRLGFIFAAAGSAIGLGSMWKFPYVTGQNGGGAFVLLYLFCTVFVCVPLFIAELVMGRAAQKGPVLAFDKLTKHSANWRAVGWLALISTIVVFSYYAVVAGWTLNYVLLSVSQFTAGKSPDQIRGVFTAMVGSGGITLFWQALFLLITAGVVYSGVRQGVERWSKILMPVLLVMLLALFIYATTLPGFGKAAHFMLYPDFSRLTSAGVLSALGLSFFTASLGFGIILTYGSYLRPEDNVVSTSIIVLLVTAGIAVIAGLTIFPILFTYGGEPGSGPGLVFQTLPVLFAKLPAALLLSTVFFALFVFTALTSTISLLENMVANAIELFGWERHRSAWIAIGIVFVVGLPSGLAGSGWLFPTWKEMYGADFLDTISTLWDRWFLPITGLLTSIFVGWRMDKFTRNREFLSGSNWRWALPIWIFLVRWFVPVAILLFLLDATGLVKIG